MTKHERKKQALGSSMGECVREVGRGLSGAQSSHDSIGRYPEAACGAGEWQLTH